MRKQEPKQVAVTGATTGRERKDGEQCDAVTLFAVTGRIRGLELPPALPQSLNSPAGFSKGS